MKKIGTDKAMNTYNRLSKNIEKVIKGKSQMIKMILAAFFCGGHVLLEDVPGTGKTTLAKALAKSIGTDFKRIQFTPDLLPADIIGVSIFNHQQGSFTFHRGPVFTNILLADEINRANPRTQSALLEAMGEKQVSVEGRRLDLSSLFFVIATENPIESHGTYPLPESQMDRFMVKLSPGYLNRDDEVEVISDQLFDHPLDMTKGVASEEDVFAVMDAVLSVRISEELRYFIVDIIGATRKNEYVGVGASVRASLALMKMSQALALFTGREFVVPEDIRMAAVPVIGHRLQVLPQAKFSGITPQAVIQQILEDIEILE
ncbi:MAG: MoxR family ATPase [Desulfocapsaceae bacterium]|nr:MoxR family ATPase [Desulfocapsaceae bacterium]